MSAWPYYTAQWKRLRLEKLRMNPLCEYGPHDRPVAAAAVDHVKPISGGGDAFDLANLKSSCVSCHSRKTARGPEAGAVRSGKPQKGCNPDGSPLDPRHPWNA